MSEQDRRNKSKKKKQRTDCQEFTWIGTDQEKCERCGKPTPGGAVANMEDKDEDQ